MGGRRRWLLQPGISQWSEPARGAAHCNAQAPQASLRCSLKLISAGLARWSERFSRGPLPVARYCAAKPRNASLQDSRISYTGLMALRAAWCLAAGQEVLTLNVDHVEALRTAQCILHSRHVVLLPASRVASDSKHEAQSSHCQAAVLDLLELVLLQLRLRSLAVA